MISKDDRHIPIPVNPRIREWLVLTTPFVYKFSKLRFIHSDGSRLCMQIGKDINLAIQMIDSENELLPIDDFE
jgi:hypothetical protein